MLSSAKAHLQCLADICLGCAIFRDGGSAVASFLGGGGGSCLLFTSGAAFRAVGAVEEG